MIYIVAIPSTKFYPRPSLREYKFKIISNSKCATKLNLQSIGERFCAINPSRPPIDFYKGNPVKIRVGNYSRLVGITSFPIRRSTAQYGEIYLSTSLPLKLKWISSIIGDYRLDDCEENSQKVIKQVSKPSPTIASKDKVKTSLVR